MSRYLTLESFISNTFEYNICTFVVRVLYRMFTVRYRTISYRRTGTGTVPYRTIPYRTNVRYRHRTVPYSTSTLLLLLHGFNPTIRNFESHQLQSGMKITQVLNFKTQGFPGFPVNPGFPRFYPEPKAVFLRL